MIKLPEPVELSDSIKPIPIACSANPQMDVVAIGNGLVKDGDPDLAPILQYTELKTITRDVCLKKYPFLVYRTTFLCVNGAEKRGTCIGDSGGPLITANNNALVGLTSFSSPKRCATNAPKVFTRIASFTKWIKETTGVDCQN